MVSRPRQLLRWALFVCLLAGGANGMQFAAQIGSEGVLLDQVCQELSEAAEAFQSHPEAGREVVDRLIERRPAHLASCLLDLLSRLSSNPRSLTGDVNEEPFVRAVAESLARKSLQDRIPQAVLDSYLRSGPDVAARRAAAWADLSALQGSRASAAPVEEEDEAGGDSGKPAGLASVIDAFRTLGDPLGLSRALMRSGEEKLAREDTEGASDDLREAASAARRAGDRWLEIRAKVLLGEALSSSGRAAEALLTYDEAATSAEEIRDPFWQAEATRRGAATLMDIGNPLEALDRFLTAAEMFGQQDSSESRRAALEGAAEACLQAAQAILDRPDSSVAQDLIGRGLRYASETGNDLLRPRLLLVRADLLTRAGKKKEAVDLLRESLEVFRLNADDQGMLASAARLAGLVENDHPAEAVDLYREAAEAASALTDDEQVGRLLSRSAELARRRGMRKEARKSLSIGLSEEWGILSLETADNLHLTEGHLALEEGRIVDALSAYGRVRGANPVAREARWGEGMALLRTGQPSAAADTLLDALPPGQLPCRALLASVLRSLDAAGRGAEATELLERLSPILAERQRAQGDRADASLVALRALFDLRGGDRQAAVRAGKALSESKQPAELYDAAGLLAAAGMSGESRGILARARRLGLDPVLRCLDPMLGR